MYNCVCSRLGEVNGFYDYDEYTRFCHMIEGFVTNKLLVEVPVDPDYHEGMIYGGRWFRCCECGKIWRLIPPDYPFKGLWEPVVAAQ